MCLFLWTDPFNAPLLPVTPPPRALDSDTPQQAGTFVGHCLSEELLQSLVCANQTWPLDALGWWCSASASPEQLLWVCFHSSFVSCSRYCKSSPATRVSGVLLTQLPSPSTCSWMLINDNELPAIGRGELVLLFVCWCFIISTYAQLILFLTVLAVLLDL